MLKGVKMDPIEFFPEEILKHILKDLSTSDILKLSMVSKRWYNYFGKSKDIMKNLVVRYRWEDDDISHILNSTRMYQNFVFKFDDDDVYKLEPAAKSMRSIINKFSASIVRIYTSQDFNRVFDLPNLKQLYFFNRNSGGNSRWMQNTLTNSGLLCNTKSMEKLTVQSLYGNYSKKLFKKNLMEMDNLKELSVLDTSFLINLDSKDYNFELKSLGLHSVTGNPITILAMENFIRAHGQSLEEIDYALVTYDIMVFLLSECPKLRKLRIFLSSFGADSPALPLNTSITELEFKDFWTCYDSFIAIILPKLSNLQMIKVAKLNGPILDTIFASSSIRNVVYNRLPTRTSTITANQQYLMLHHPRIKFTRLGRNHFNYY